MLDQLIKKILKRAAGSPPFDPSTLNDTVATKTDWFPIEDSGANFRTHKLVKISEDRMEFQATIGVKLFCMVFVLVGCCAISYFLYKNYPLNQSELTIKNYPYIIVGLVFLASGLCFLYFASIPRVVDKQERFFWKGKIPPSKVFDKGSLKGCCELDNIYALQIISKYCSGNKSSYFSYELNIVL